MHAKRTGVEFLDPNQEAEKRDPGNEVENFVSLSDGLTVGACHAQKTLTKSANCWVSVQKNITNEQLGPSPKAKLNLHEKGTQR